MLGRSGVHPGSSVYRIGAALRRFGSSALRPTLEGVGGDEETRTPDPLLAKEMLYRLSYVPLVMSGGPSHLRTQSPSSKWWAFLDSNQRPLPYQGSALTS